MDAGKPSQTALAAAWHRATHHLIDTPVLLPDPVLVAILEAWNGKPIDLEGLRKVAAPQRGLRALIVARKLFAQETLAKAITRGVRQYVLLGAGLEPRLGKFPRRRGHLSALRLPP
jgi:O-methyltransferase involved in polyketide biosynthesis